MAKTIRFVKMQGVGNDFVVVNAEGIAGLDVEQVAIRLCERRFGIGADGLLVIGPASDPAAALTFGMHNPDGTPDMCGNGLRCAVLYAHRLGLTPPSATTFLIDTVDGLLEARVLEITDEGRPARITVQMAVPRLTAPEIPFTGAPEAGQVVDYPLPVGDLVLPITAVNTGSTHAVAFVDELPSEEMFQAISPLIENHVDFPERASLMWAKQTGGTEFSIRIWERGAGETLGCGTGACAVAVASILTGRVPQDHRILVRSKGGPLEIDWPDANSPIRLTGPAQWVFEGEFPWTDAAMSPATAA